MPSLLQPRAGLSCCVLKGQIYVFGGLDLQSNSILSIEALDIKAKTLQWKIVGQLTQQVCRSLAVIVAISSDTAVIMGGGNVQK